jgi:hypothetical protein
LQVRFLPGVPSLLFVGSLALTSPQALYLGSLTLTSPQAFYLGSLTLTSPQAFYLGSLTLTSPQAFYLGSLTLTSPQALLSSHYRDLILMSSSPRLFRSSLELPQDFWFPTSQQDVI